MLFLLFQVHVYFCTTLPSNEAPVVRCHEIFYSLFMLESVESALPDAW